MSMNNETVQYILVGVIAYLIGNINPAIIIGKLHHIDIRKEGSGNAGMTNTMRVIGLHAGIAVLLIDVLKAYIAVRIGFYMCDLTGSMIAFAAVVLGHCFPVFFGFKGGKGVAASLGAALALNWLSAVAAVIVALVMFVLTRRMSIGSICAALAYPAFVHYYEPDCFYFAVGAAVFLVIMHAANIIRIAKGEEKALTLGHMEDGDAGEEDAEAAA
ncbi:MAG: glycerol-3-phosphate 1-O-acyltransferase PlsY, partial [Clostridiales bacterium]|nr:glycerol-3-phosphate 1-O-acyltransferase PlsY [Clostridiales bacterium]